MRGIDVSLESSNICVVDASGRIVREGKVSSEPEALIAWFAGLAIQPSRVGLEAGPLSQWLRQRSSVATLTPTSRDTRSTGELSGGNNRATTRSL